MSNCIPFDDLVGRFGSLAFLDGNHTVVPDLLHRLREQVADLAVVVGADGAQTSAISSLLVTRLAIERSSPIAASTARSTPWRMLAGFDPAVTFRRPSL